MPTTSKITRKPAAAIIQQEEEDDDGDTIMSTTTTPATAAAVERAPAAKSAWTDNMANIDMDSLSTYVHSTRRSGGASGSASSSSSADGGTKKKLDDFVSKHQRKLTEQQQQKSDNDEDSINNTAVATKKPTKPSAAAQTKRKRKAPAAAAAIAAEEEDEEESELPATIVSRAKPSKNEEDDDDDDEETPAVAPPPSKRTKKQQQQTPAAPAEGKRRKTKGKQTASIDDEESSSAAAAEEDTFANESVSDTLTRAKKSVSAARPQASSSTTPMKHPEYNPVHPSELLIESARMPRVGNIKAELTASEEEEEEEEAIVPQRILDKNINDTVFSVAGSSVRKQTQEEVQESIAQVSINDFTNLMVSCDYEQSKPQFQANASRINYQELIRTANTSIDGSSVRPGESNDSNILLTEALSNSFEDHLATIQRGVQKHTKQKKENEHAIPVVRASALQSHEYRPHLVPAASERFGAVFDSRLRENVPSPFDMQEMQRQHDQQQKSEDDMEDDGDNQEEEEDMADGELFWIDSDEEVDEAQTSPFSYAMGISTTPYVHNLQNSLFRQHQQRTQQERQSGNRSAYFPDFPFYSTHVCAQFLREADPTNPRERPCCYAQQVDAGDDEYMHNPLKNQCCAFRDFGVTLREFTADVSELEALPKSRRPCLYCERYTTCALFWRARANNDQLLNTVIQSHSYKTDVPGGYKLAQAMLPQARTYTGLPMPFIDHSSSIYVYSDNVASCKANRNVPLRGLKEREHLFFQQ